MRQGVKSTTFLPAHETPESFDLEKTMHRTFEKIWADDIPGAAMGSRMVPPYGLMIWKEYT
jgi:hypothetical protein